MKQLLEHNNDRSSLELAKQMLDEIPNKAKEWFSLVTGFDSDWLIKYGEITENKIVALYLYGEIGYKPFYIDYCDMINFPKYKCDFNEMERMFYGLKDLAMKYKIPIITTIQGGG